MKITSISLIVLSIGLGIPAAHAADTLDCNNAMTQGDMNECAYRDLKHEDQALNAAYNAYRARLSAKQKEQLKTVQLAWIKYRDLACDYDSSGVEGGSVRPMIYAQCITRRTHQRLEEIKALADCKDGDLSCPTPGE
ncbi:lysozyme inhibitor LprI family protein [Uliginosibacterium gangwonense]|uniref:lysozyme inhibitor LprI family protein n=1 Tax=Uliginosibacterium gangwonense TaxID=392736 RepID=UPI000371D78C|nr:lysozyme inhibitor LprI family protein [Uliginosibacterium gangwonense]